jgi:hypothetical protein
MAFFSSLRSPSIAFQLVVIWALVIGVFFVGLTTGPLTDIDEGAFSEASREMLARGDWISPWLLDTPRFDKPVLIHWLQMASLSLFGLTTFAARLPSALAGIAWVAGIGLFAIQIARHLGFSTERARMVYFWAISLAGASIGLSAIGRAATADATLNALLTFSLFFIWRFFFVSDSQVAGRWASVCIGLGVLTKGPIAILIPFIGSLFAAVGFGAMTIQKTGQALQGGRLRRIVGVAIRKWLELLKDPLSWAIFFLICAPWYVLQFQAQGEAFLAGFFGTHNVGRFIAPMHGFSSGPWYYPIWIVVATLPWLPMLVRLFIFAFRDPNFRRPDLWMLWGVFFFVLVFFSISATKLPHYGFYGLSGCLVLMAFAATTAIPTTALSNSPGKTVQDTSVPNYLFDRLFLFGLFVLVSVIPFWWGALSERIVDPYYRQVWDMTETHFKANWAWFLLPLAFGGAVVILKSKFGLMLAGLFFAIFLHGVVVAAVTNSLRGPVVLAAQEVQKLSAETVITWRLSAPSLSFYAQRVIRTGTPDPGTTVVIYSKDLPKLKKFFQEEHNVEPAVQSVWEQGGIQIIRLQ